jgi:HPt (histidine-containing phosphotransfer) domain-containing protein
MLLVEVLDRAAALRRLGGDEQLFKEALLSFRESAPAQIESLGLCLAKGDAAQLKQQAEALQDAAARVGASGMEHVASCLAEAGRTKDLSEAESLLNKLEMEFEWLCLILNTSACSGNL